MHWRTPVFVHRVEDDEGPILLTVEFRIDPKDRAPFLAVMHEIGLERKRDGAYAWGVFEDVQVSGRIVETFLVQSMLELKHMRTRVTVADRMIMDQARAFLKEPLKVTYLVAPKRNRHARRKGRRGSRRRSRRGRPRSLPGSGRRQGNGNRSVQSLKRAESKGASGFADCCEGRGGRHNCLSQRAAHKRGR